MGRLRKIHGYEVLATLGSGAKSTIYAVKDRDSHVYALKHVIKEGPKEQRFLDQAILEHNVASRLKHPNLRCSYKLFRHRNLLRTTEVFVLMEMVDAVTFEQYKPATYIDYCRLFQQVASGLEAMHEAGYVHADIKPNNIMITDANQVKLIDFGQSCVIDTIKKRIQGTPDYIAPEQVKRHKITPLTDVFNLGATMYWLLTGRHVPTMIPKQRRIRKVDENPCPTLAELNPKIPLALSTLVMDCVRRIPSQRPVSMEVLRERLALAISQLERDEGNSVADASLNPDSRPQSSAI